MSLVRFPVCPAFGMGIPAHWLVMERELLNGVIRTDYGQLDLVWTDGGGFDGDWDRFFRGQVNGLVGAADPTGVYVSLARRSGGSPVRIMVLDLRPPLPDDAWEDVVEVSTTIPEDSQPRWVAWAGMGQGSLGSLPPGNYRLRVSARGRDEGAANEFADEPVDHYLIELWPAPLEPDAVLRTGSRNADYWHREVGQRR